MNASMNPVRRLALYLIRPSRYDDEGYPVRHLRPVIPGNTLATLHGLTRDAVRKGDLGRVRVDTTLVDEMVQPIPYRRILRDSHPPVRIGGCPKQVPFDYSGPGDRALSRHDHNDPPSRSR